MRVALNGVGVEVKKFEHPGPLLVMTTRGEVKCHRNDYVVTFGDGSSCVIPASALEPIIKVDLVMNSEGERSRGMSDADRAALPPAVPSVPDSPAPPDSFNRFPRAAPDPGLLNAEIELKAAQERYDAAVTRADATDAVIDRISADDAAKALDAARAKLDVEQDRVERGLDDAVMARTRMPTTREEILADESARAGLQGGMNRKDESRMQLSSDEDARDGGGGPRLGVAEGMRIPAPAAANDPNDISMLKGR